MVILIIDDEKNILKYTKSMLEREGHIVHTAEDGVDGAVIINELQTDIDLIICDLNMPRLDGFSLYVWLVSELPEVAASRFVFHTSQCDELDQYEQTENTPKMDKPGEPGEFLRVVRSMLAQRARTPLSVAV